MMILRLILLNAGNYKRLISDIWDSKKKTMERDVLFFLRFLAINLNCYKPVRLLLMSNILLHVLLLLLQLYFFIRCPFRYFMKYSPNFFFTLYGVVVGISVIVKKEIVVHFWDGLNLWSLDNAGCKLKKSITQNIWYLKLFVVLNTSLSIWTVGTMLWPNPSVDINYYFLTFIVSCKFPKYTNVFCNLLKLNLLPLAYLMLIHPYLLLYAAFHLKYQIYMIVEHINYMTSEYNCISEIELLCDQRFQVKMEKRLIFFIKRHVELLEWALTMKKRMVRPLFSFLTIFGVMLGLSVVNMLLFTFSTGNEVFNRLNLIRFTSYAAVTFTTFAGLIHAGQTLESESGSVLDKMTAIRWLPMNKTNRQILTILIQLLSKPSRVDFSQNLAVNYQLGLQMLRLIWSGISLMYSIKRKGKTS